MPRSPQTISPVVAPPDGALRRAPVPVGPGRSGPARPPRSGPLRDDPDGYPIELAKVQPPVLRDTTLERPRLLDWLRVKVHGRVVLLIADAGYGKTTLLADFARRSRRRTLWYRLDDDDRDWVTLLYHLVAAGQEHDPGFAPQTVDLLARTGIGGPGREEVLDRFLEELPTIAPQGATLILDDFHLVDDAADARHIARELLARAPERLTIVFASRRPPTVPLARLRTVGDVAELGTDDLRFDVDETTRLFNDTYGRALEPDVLADLTARTEGWIASLQLVQAALRDRSPTEIRRFVRSLTGADHDLYDYLAEEVVGDLPLDLQRFLMATSILQIVTPELAGVVSGTDEASVTSLTAAAERLTLLGRMSGSPRTHRRYHPLVREFLEARLRNLDGPAAVAELHRRTAQAVGDADWRVAAYHYREAGDVTDMLDVLGTAIPAILGNGQYALAESFIGGVSDDLRQARFDLILSRVDMQHGDYQAAIDASLAVLDADGSDPVERDHALLNLATLYINYGDGDRAVTYAERLRNSPDPNLAMIAEACVLMTQIAYDGNLDEYARLLTQMAKAQRPTSIHHFGVSMLNLAVTKSLQDEPEEGLDLANQALEAFESTSSRMERASATSTRAVALARLGMVGQAADLVEAAASDRPDPDLLIEAAQFHDDCGDPDAYTMLVDWATRLPNLTPSHRRNLSLLEARHLARVGDGEGAERVLDGLVPGRWTGICFEAHRLTVAGHAALVRHDETATALLEAARELAGRQRAHYWERTSGLLLAIASGEPDLSRSVVLVGQRTPWHLSDLAQLLLPRVGAMASDARAAIEQAAAVHPARWLFELRSFVDEPTSTEAKSLVGAASILESIGTRDDISRLRAVARAHRRTAGATSLGKALIRRTADPVFIEDQGRVGIRVGDRLVHSSDVRRKVLALLCFLLTRPQMSGTRDQVLEALWPELDPEAAVNSLNQTLYFFRRVLEESYVEDTSPGYIHHSADVLWLDPELVTSRSVECRRLIRSLGEDPPPDDVERLVDLYAGRFALDFEYEEWAGAYRDSLHASYLDVVERALLKDADSGFHERGIRIARRVMEVDPQADQIEVALLRLYRLVGAHAAAAEQYAHYASVMRDEYGIEPPPLDSV